MFCWLILPCFLLFLVMEILHADEDTSAVFVWDGTDAPPASILAKWVLTAKEKSFKSSHYLFWVIHLGLTLRFPYPTLTLLLFGVQCLAIDRRSEEDKAFSSLSVHTLLSRDVLLSFPTVGTILRVHLSSHLFYRVKPGDWVKLYHLLCEVDRGSWVIKVTSSTKVHHLAQDDRLVEKIMRFVLLDISFSNYFRPFCIPWESLTILFYNLMCQKLGYMIRDYHQSWDTFHSGVFRHLLD